MGGHGHDSHHEPPYVVPNPEFYKIEDAPELLKHRDKLAKHNLTDPWIRNYIWRYHRKHGTMLTRWRDTFSRGVIVGIVAFGITIAVENYLGVDYHPWHHEHKDHEKHDH